MPIFLAVEGASGTRLRRPDHVTSPLPSLRQFIDRISRRQHLFWRDLHPWALTTLLLGIFFTFSSLGFLTDLAFVEQQAFTHALYHAFVAGACAVASAWVAMKRLSWLPLAIGLQILLVFPVELALKHIDWLRYDPASLSRRLLLDMIGSIVGIAAGYGFFMLFIVREGLRFVHVQTELRVARTIHQKLVPPIERVVGQFEFCGVSLPSGHVGGDLIDVVESPSGRWIAYLADVAGHGVASALLTGLVKSAVRGRIMAPSPLPAVVADVNRIVCENSDPNMFVTFAAISGNARDSLECVVAGHPPVLRISRGSTVVEEIARPNLPLGVDAEWVFDGISIPWKPGDVLVFVSDGLFEVFDHGDHEFALDGLKEVLARSAGRPLHVMRDDVYSAVRRHGRQLDDQTILLVRSA